MKDNFHRMTNYNNQHLEGINTAAAALRHSEQRLRLLIAASSNQVYHMNADWTRMEHLVGKELLADTSEPMSDWMNKYILPEDQSYIQSVIRQVIAAGSTFDLEHRVILKDGSVGWVHSHAVPLLNEQGEIAEWFGATTDITERKQAETMLRNSEEHFRIALESAGLAAWDWNLETDKVIWNKQHYLLLGMQPKRNEMPSDSFLKRIHPEDLAYVQEQLQEALEKTGTYRAEFRIIRDNDGAVCWMNGYGRVLERKNGKAIRMTGVMLDITERKHLEQQKEEFLNVASHELKTPITSLKVYTQMLQEMFEEVGDMIHLELMKKVNAQADRLATLVNALLDTTRIAEKQLVLHIRQFDLNALILERAEDFQYISPVHQLITHPCHSVWITADRERIDQVLSNLISNAIKYSPKGGEVTIDCEVKENSIQVSVSDRGIGIAREVQSKVFDRFFRMENTREQNYPGMGLGLYITAGIVHRHGGKIWVESEPGKGSTFYFTLPALQFM